MVTLHPMVILAYFLIFSALGWIIDSAFRSIEDKRLTSGTLIPGISPLYGFGAVILIMIFSTPTLSVYEKIGLGTAAMILLELIVGILCAKVLHRRFWDYSRNKWNIGGYIDLIHCIYWLILVIAFAQIYTLL